jgi:hypothetical protein
VAVVLTGYVRDRCAEYVPDVAGARFVADLLATLRPAPVRL